MVICLSTSPSCHTATQWQNLMKVQDLTGEELSQASSALVSLCDSFAKCRLILAAGIFCPNRLLCQNRKLVLLSPAGRAGGGVEFASVLIGLNYSQ